MEDKCTSSIALWMGKWAECSHWPPRVPFYWPCPLPISLPYPLLLLGIISCINLLHLNANQKVFYGEIPEKVIIFHNWIIWFTPVMDVPYSLQPLGLCTNSPLYLACSPPPAHHPSHLLDGIYSTVNFTLSLQLHSWVEILWSHTHARTSFVPLGICFSVIFHYIYSTYNTCSPTEI